MKQAELFITSEGDAWHDRNKDKPRLPDPVIDAIGTCHIQPKAVVEIGCGDGWRLAELQKIYKPQLCNGYEPSKKAWQERVFPNVFCYDALHALSNIGPSRYDCIIFGFCLYLVDREDLFFIAAAADAALKDKGYIIIHDFFPTLKAYRRPYKHKEGAWSYKMEYANLWLGHPAYHQIYGTSVGDDDERVAVIVLQKDMVNAFPVREL